MEKTACLSVPEKYAFRSVLPEEAEQTARIEQICFPPNEACSREHMLQRVSMWPDMFLAAVDRDTGLIAGFVNGLSAAEPVFRDEFFTDPSLHRPDGRSLMILGLDVLPGHRRQGLGTELMKRFLGMARERGTREAILTCHEEKVEMYRKMGYADLGLSASQWGGVRWHEMICRL